MKMPALPVEVADQDRKILLALARSTIQARLAGRPLPPLPVLQVDESRCGGVFVTMHNTGRLRGCIGRFGMESDGLAASVQQMALASLNDPRFRLNPVIADEVPAIDIEISVLSVMEPVSDPLVLQVGVHGIYICQGGQRGCFLPQVAPEMHWTAEQFLTECCVNKAGLPADAWKSPDCQVQLFSATVFGEKLR